MKLFLARAAIAALGLWLADSVLEAVYVENVVALWMTALVLGLVNATIRPIVVILTLPLTLVTLGLFLLVVNGAMLLLVALVVPSFHLGGLGSAVLASLILAVTGWIANAFIGPPPAKLHTRRSASE